MKKCLYLMALLLCSYSASILPSAGENSASILPSIEENNATKFINKEGNKFIAQIKERGVDLKNEDLSDFIKVDVITKFEEMFNIPADVEPSGLYINAIINYLVAKAKGENPPLPTNIVIFINEKGNEIIEQIKQRGVDLKKEDLSNFIRPDVITEVKKMFNIPADVAPSGLFINAIINYLVAKAKGENPPLPNNVVIFINEKGDELIAAASKNEDGKFTSIPGYKIQVEFKKLFNKPAGMEDITAILTYLNQKGEGKNPLMPGQESDVIKFIKEKGDKVINDVKSMAQGLEPSNFKFRVIVEFKKMFNITDLSPEKMLDITPIINYLSAKAKGENPPMPGTQPSQGQAQKLEPEQKSHKKETTLSLKDQFLANESSRLIQKFIKNDISIVTEDDIKSYSLFLGLNKAAKEYDSTKDFVIRKLQELLDAKLKELGKEPGKSTTQDKNSYFKFDTSDKKGELYPAYLYLNTNGTSIINTYITKGIAQVASADIDREFFEFCKDATKRPVRPEDTDFKKWKAFVLVQLQETLTLKIAQTTQKKSTNPLPTQQKSSDSFNFKVNGEKVTLNDTKEENYRAKYFLNEYGKMLVGKFIDEKRPLEQLRKFVEVSTQYKLFLRNAKYNDDDDDEKNNDFDFIVAQIQTKIALEQSKKPILTPTQKTTPKPENPLEDMDIETIIKKLDNGQLTPKRGAEALRKLQAGIDSADQAAKKVRAAQETFQKDLDARIASLQEQHAITLQDLLLVHKAEKDALAEQLKKLQQELETSKSSALQKKEAERVIERAEISIGTDPIIDILAEAVVNEKSPEVIAIAISDAATQMTDITDADQLAQDVRMGMLTPQEAAQILEREQQELQNLMIQRLQDLRAKYDLRFDEQERIHKLALEAQEQSYTEQINALSKAIAVSKASPQEQQSALNDLADLKENISSELCIQVCKQHAEQLAKALLRTDQNVASQEALTKVMAQEDVTIACLDNPVNMAYLMGYVQMKLWMLQGDVA